MAADVLRETQAVADDEELDSYRIVFMRQEWRALAEVEAYGFR
ncbi:Hit-family protein OS=Streptomyces glaucescens OX=1907 GN=SGLAU_11605 PE=4 SV=1 [Streptomyces glaucescens]